MSNSAITGPVLSDVSRSQSGTAAAPSWSFVNSTATGMYLVSSNVLGITTAGAQRMVVDASGNVGIGTASPSGASGRVLEINGGAGQARLVLKNNTTGSAAGDGGQIVMVDSTLTIQNREADSITFETNLQERMRIDASGKLSVGNNSSSNTIGGLINIESNGLNNQGGFTYYYNASAPNATGFYVNSPQSGTNTANWYAFYSRVAGGDRFYVTGAGVIHASNTSVQPIASDINLKQDIVDYDKGLNEVLKMKPRYFSWKAEPERRDVGFIAQEMDEALAGSMVENKEGNKTYSVEWYPILVKAIQEQQEIIAKLEARLAALESA
jgi:hypothetical protein